MNFPGMPQGLSEAEQSAAMQKNVRLLPSADLVLR